MRGQPAQAIATNIQGTQNVIDAAQENGVERVIFTSSDKAVNPTNVMGTSKLMGERLMTAAAETTANGLDLRARNTGHDFRLHPVRQRAGLARVGGAALSPPDRGGRPDHSDGSAR